MAGKRNAIKDQDGRREWSLTKLESGCMVCGTRKADFRGFSVHHILNGRHGRSDEACNYLLACGVCHDLLENRRVTDGNGLYIPTIPLGMAMTIKWVRDQESWDLERLAKLSGERLPNLEKPHPWIELAYLHNKPIPFKPLPDDEDSCMMAISIVNEWINSYQILRQ